MESFNKTFYDIKYRFNINLFNVLARFNPDIKDRFMIMAHWDTREIADKEEDIINQTKPILGANEGASGIAILMIFDFIV